MFRRLSAVLSLAVLATGLAAAAPVSAQGLGHSSLSSAVGTRANPLDVEVGVRLNQITAVDQKSENYGTVANIRMRWHDPTLAFDRAETGRAYRIFTPGDFVEHAREIGAIVPGFVIQNQQSNRWIHQSLVAVLEDGTANYSEKSSLTLQAPHFDFTRYPFDRQMFYFDIVSNLPTELVRYSVMDEFTGLGDQLGEEEWMLGEAAATVSTDIGITGLESAKVSLGFSGTRHLQYYVLRIFTPMLVLIVVSWTAFFLDEYRKRAEIAGANLLVFVAFNWMISDSLPKLGYLTFLDFILQWMFIFTGAIIVFNVILSRLEMTGRGGLARTLDNYVMRWIYPLGYLAVVVFAAYRFLYIA